MSYTLPLLMCSLHVLYDALLLVCHGTKLRVTSDRYKSRIIHNSICHILYPVYVHRVYSYSSLYSLHVLYGVLLLVCHGTKLRRRRTGTSCTPYTTAYAIYCKKSHYILPLIILVAIQFSGLTLLVYVL